MDSTLSATLPTNRPSPSITLEPNRMAIGWRQFDTVTSNFRQAGWGWSDDRGRAGPSPVSSPRECSGRIRSSMPMPTVAFTTTASGLGHLPLRFLLLQQRRADLDRPDIGLRRRQAVVHHRPDRWRRPRQHLRELEHRRESLGEADLHPVDRRRQHASPNPSNSARRPSGELSPPIRMAASIWPATRTSTTTSLSSTDRSMPGTPASIRPSMLRRQSRWPPDHWSDGPNRDGLLGQVWIAANHSNGPNRGDLYVVASVDPPGWRPAGRPLHPIDGSRARAGVCRSASTPMIGGPGSGSAPCRWRPTAGSMWCGSSR